MNELTGYQTIRIKSIIAKYNKKDYWNVQDQIINQVRAWQIAKEKGDANANKYTLEQIKAYYKDQHEIVIMTYITDILNNYDQPEWIIEHVRYNQNFTIEIMEVLTGLKLKGLTNKKLQSTLIK